MTGGIGRPGGDGVIHSPTSVVNSATIPSKGARRIVFSRFTRAAARAACAWPIRARAASHAAADASRRLWSWSSNSTETSCSRESA
jgi:hypothetical protein